MSSIAAIFQVVVLSLYLVHSCTLAVPLQHYSSEHLVKRFVEANFTVEEALKHLHDNLHITDRPNHHSRNTRQSGLNCHSTNMYGGRRGSYFQDPCHPAIKRIDIGDHAGNSARGALIYIRVTYKNGQNQDVQAALHGSSIDTALHRINFAQGEHIIAVVGRHSTHYRTGRIHQLGFLTRSASGAKQVFGPYGAENGNLFVVNADVVSFFGRSGRELDALGFFYIP